MATQTSGSRKPGRPLGSSKNGKRSPEKKLNILRTKTWSWTCSYYLRNNSEERPISTYALEQRAKEEGFTIDATQWRRYRKGERGITRKGPSIWPETHPVFHIGPWINESSIMGSGGFVPLWESIFNSQPSEIFKAWKSVPKSAWEAWAPLNDSSEDCFEYPGLDPNYILEECDSLIKLRPFLEHLTRPKKWFPPIVSLAAALSVARLRKNTTMWLFAPMHNPSRNKLDKFSLRPSMRSSVLKSLAEEHLCLDEIIDATCAHGLTIHDCGNMSYEEYKNLRWPTSTPMIFETPIIVKFIESDYETVEIDENDWRDFFETPFQ